MIETEFARRGVSTVYHFFTGHSDVAHLGGGFSHFSSGFSLDTESEMMRWDGYHQSEARRAFLKRDDFLLGVLELKHYFHNEKE